MKILVLLFLSGCVVRNSRMDVVGSRNVRVDDSRLFTVGEACAPGDEGMVREAYTVQCVLGQQSCIQGHWRGPALFPDCP